MITALRDFQLQYIESLSMKLEIRIQKFIVRMKTPNFDANSRVV